MQAASAASVPPGCDRVQGRGELHSKSNAKHPPQNPINGGDERAVSFLKSDTYPNSIKKVYIYVYPIWEVIPLEPFELN